MTARKGEGTMRFRVATDDDVALMEAEIEDWLDYQVQAAAEDGVELVCNEYDFSCAVCHQPKKIKDFYALRWVEERRQRICRDCYLSLLGPPTLLSKLFK